MIYGFQLLVHRSKFRFGGDGLFTGAAGFVIAKIGSMLWLWLMQCLRSQLLSLIDIFRLRFSANSQHFAKAPKERHKHELAFGNVA